MSFKLVLLSMLDLKIARMDSGCSLKNLRKMVSVLEWSTNLLMNCNQLTKIISSVILQYALEILYNTLDKTNREMGKSWNDVENKLKKHNKKNLTLTLLQFLSRTTC